MDSSHHTIQRIFKSAVAVVFLACGCANGDAPVRRVLARMAAADTAGDLDGIVRLYTSDAVLYPPKGPPHRGTAAIRQSYEGLFTTYEVVVSITPEDIAVDHNWAWVSGTTEVRLAPKDTAASSAAARVDRDRFLMVLRRNAKQWLVHRLQWHPR